MIGDWLCILGQRCTYNTHFVVCHTLFSICAMLCCAVRDITHDLECSNIYSLNNKHHFSDGITIESNWYLPCVLRINKANTRVYCDWVYQSRITHNIYVSYRAHVHTWVSEWTDSIFDDSMLKNGVKLRGFTFTNSFPSQSAQRRQDVKVGIGY